MDFGVYVHVPFCRVQCPYCTFYTVLRPQEASPFGLYAAALEREWVRRVRPRLERGDRVRTLYLGGGTPSDLPVEPLAALLQSFAADLPGGLAALDETTVECNPESCTEEIVAVLRGAGVGRVSLGVQALDDRDLRVLGRGADAATNRRAIEAVAARFPSWSADLILGIPGSEPSRVETALRHLHAAGAPHLSFYCLELPPDRARRLGDPQTEDSEAAKAALYEWTSAWVEAHGYLHYEISNAARPGHASQHNSAYWGGREYVGLGPGAHSLEAGFRRANRPDLGAWERALAAGMPPPATEERLTPTMRARERVLVGLRLRDGLPLADLGEPLPVDLIQRLESAGLATLAGDRIRLTPRGWMVSDSIVLQLVTD